MLVQCIYPYNSEWQRDGLELKKQYFFKERIILKLLFVTLLHRSRAYVSLGPCHTCTLTFRCSAVNMVNSLKTTC